MEKLLKYFFSPHSKVREDNRTQVLALLENLINNRWNIHLTRDPNDELTNPKHFLDILFKKLKIHQEFLSSQTLPGKSKKQVKELIIRITTLVNDKTNAHTLSEKFIAGGDKTIEYINELITLKEVFQNDLTSEVFMTCTSAKENGIANIDSLQLLKESDMAGGILAMALYNKKLVKSSHNIGFACYDGTLYICLRGSADTNDFTIDYKILSAGIERLSELHRRVKSYLPECVTIIEKYNRKGINSLRIVGHSLGGLLACLLAQLLTNEGHIASDVDCAVLLYNPFFGLGLFHEIDTQTVFVDRCLLKFKNN